MVSGLIADRERSRGKNELYFYQNRSRFDGRAKLDMTSGRLLSKKFPGRDEIVTYHDKPRSRFILCSTKNVRLPVV